MRVFLQICAVLDRLTTIVCILACLAMTGAVLVIVILRYGFGLGFIELQDFAAYAFATLLILSLPVCLRRGGHVRVEVFSERLPAAYARRADAVAVFLFLIPVFGLMIWAWWPDLLFSWSIREASVETGGLPGLFLIKSVLPIGALLMILQGLAMVFEPSAQPRPPAEL